MDPVCPETKETENKSLVEVLIMSKVEGLMNREPVFTVPQIKELVDKSKIIRQVIRTI